MIFQNTVKPAVSHAIRFTLIACCLLLALLPMSIILAQDYGTTPQEAEPTVTEEVLVESDAAPSNLTEKEQMRQALLELLQPEVSEEGSDGDGLVSYDQGVIGEWDQTRTNALGEKISQLVRNAPSYPEALSAAFARCRAMRNSPR